jgi:hypothetical protein
MSAQKATGWLSQPFQPLVLASFLEMNFERSFAVKDAIYKLTPLSQKSKAGHIQFG